MLPITTSTQITWIAYTIPIARLFPVVIAIGLIIYNSLVANRGDPMLASTFTTLAEWMFCVAWTEFIAPPIVVHTQSVEVAYIASKDID